MRTTTTRGMLAAAMVAAGFQAASAADTAMTPLQVPAKTLQVPTADISPEMQKFIGAPLNPGWNFHPKTGEEWRAMADKIAEGVVPGLPAMQDRMHVKVESTTIDGVKVNIVTPDEIPVRNRDKVIVHVHGGCYVYFPGASGTTEAIMMAGFGHYKVIAVDYRMPPEAYFPAALDDAMTVYRSVLKTTDPKNVGIIGTSAGGALTLEMVVKAKQDGLPMPGAIAPGTPMADVTKTGDSFYTNEFVDNVLVSPSGFCDDAAAFYAHGHDMQDPLLSPVNADMTGFPPTILTTGTRDQLLSNTVRVHRKLRRAGGRGRPQRLRGRVACPISVRRPRTRDEGSFRRDCSLLRSSSRRVVADASREPVMLRFSANLGFLWPDRPLLERIDAAAAAGFRAIELHWPYDVPAEHVRAACHARGVALLGINTVRGDVAAGENGLGALAGREDAFQASVDQALAFCEAAGGTAVHCMAGVVPPADRAAARHVLVRNLKTASAKAARAGLTLLLEPLKPLRRAELFLCDGGRGGRHHRRNRLRQHPADVRLLPCRPRRPGCDRHARTAAADHRPRPDRRRTEPGRARPGRARLRNGLRRPRTVALRRLDRLRIQTGGVRRTPA